MFRYFFANFRSFSVAPLPLPLENFSVGALAHKSIKVSLFHIAFRNIMCSNIAINVLAVLSSKIPKIEKPKLIVELFF